MPDIGFEIRTDQFLGTNYHTVCYDVTLYKI